MDGVYQGRSLTHARAHRLIFFSAVNLVVVWSVQSSYALCLCVGGFSLTSIQGSLVYFKNFSSTLEELNSDNLLFLA